MKYDINFNQYVITPKYPKAKVQDVFEGSVFSDDGGILKFNINYDSKNKQILIFPTKVVLRFRHYSTYTPSGLKRAIDMFNSMSTDIHDRILSDICERYSIDKTDISIKIE